MNYILGEVAQDVFVYYFSRHSLYEVSFLYGETTSIHSFFVELAFLSRSTFHKQEFLWFTHLTFLYFPPFNESFRSFEEEFAPDCSLDESVPQASGD